MCLADLTVNDSFEIQESSEYSFYEGTWNRDLSLYKLNIKVSYLFAMEMKISSIDYSCHLKTNDQCSVPDLQNHFWAFKFNSSIEKFNGNNYKSFIDFTNLNYDSAKQAYDYDPIRAYDIVSDEELNKQNTSERYLVAEEYPVKYKDNSIYSCESIIKQGINIQTAFEVFNILPKDDN